MNQPPPTILEALLMDERKTKFLYEVLRALRFRIVSVRNPYGFDIVEE